MSTTKQKALKRSAPTKRKGRTLPLTAAYLPAKEGGYTAEILEAIGVHSQGNTFEEARTNLHAAVALMLEEAPHQFRRKGTAAPPGAIFEKLFVLVPS